MPDLQIRFGIIRLRLNTLLLVGAKRRSRLSGAAGMKGKVNRAEAR